MLPGKFSCSTLLITNANRFLFFREKTLIFKGCFRLMFKCGGGGGGGGASNFKKSISFPYSYTQITVFPSKFSCSSFSITNAKSFFVSKKITACLGCFQLLFSCGETHNLKKKKKIHIFFILFLKIAVFPGKFSCSSL